MGAMITSYPARDMAYDSPMYEPLWATAEELRIPLSLQFTIVNGVVTFIENECTRKGHLYLEPKEEDIQNLDGGPAR